MLLDRYLPTYDVVERHATVVRAPADRVYAAIERADMGASPVARGLMALRALAAGPRAGGGGRTTRGTLGELLRRNFLPLADDPPRELVLGLVGKFWQPSGGVERIPPADFIAFARPGYAKAAWNFAVAPLPDGRGVRLTTETRVHCTDAASRRRFRAYWLLIRPFSGLIRREMLRVIRREAEGG